MSANMEKLECGHYPSQYESFSTGYGTDADGNRHCYDCCAIRDKTNMEETGKIMLYLTTNGENIPKRYVSNWPGSLKFPIYYLSVGRHNIAGRRYDVWFTDHTGAKWHGVQYGDMTQICHCKRLKG